MLARVHAAARDRPLLAALAALALIAVLLFALTRFPAHAVTPAGPLAARLVVADLRGHALVVLDTATGATRRIPLPGGPHELVRLADGRLVVSLEQSSRLAVVDLNAVSSEVVTVEFGGLPHGLALDGDVLFVTDRSRDELRRLNVSAHAVADWRELPPIAAGSWPHAVATLPGGALAIAAARDSTLRIGTRVLAVSALPETVSVAEGSGDVATAGALGGTLEVFDAAGHPRWSAALGGRPVRVLFAPDGATVAASLSAAHSVAIVGPDGVHRLIVVGGAPDGLAFDATGGVLFVGDLALGRVTAIDVASGAVRARFGVGESAGALMLLDTQPAIASPLAAR